MSSAEFNKKSGNSVEDSDEDNNTPLIDEKPDEKMNANKYKFHLLFFECAVSLLSVDR